MSDETVVRAYDLGDTTIRLGFGRREPVFLVVYDSGRVAVVYTLPGSGIAVELASVPR